MICKWCGARVDPAKKSCGRCGRKMLPLSDCGGFYDVVPDAPKGGQMPPAESEIRPQVNTTYSPAPVYQSTGLPGWVKATLGVLAAGVVVLSVLALGQSGKIRDLESQNGNSTLQNEVITEYIEVPVTVPAPVVTDPTEPPESNPTLLEKLENKLTGEEDASTAFVNGQLEKVSQWQDLAKQWTTVKNSPWQSEGIKSSLDEVLELHLKQFEKPEEQNDPNAPSADSEDQELADSDSTGENGDNGSTEPSSESPVQAQG